MQACSLFALLLVQQPLHALTSEDASERKYNSLSMSQCSSIVDKVQERGKYTEESIGQICNDEVHSQKCEFFAEALSLASGHADFESKKFCGDITEAHFCSDTMDRLLASDPISDLAYGACMHARPSRGDGYCNKFKMMLAQAVTSTDLDTMRACYMMEAYSDGSGKEAEDEKADKKTGTAADKPSSASDGNDHAHAGPTITVVSKSSSVESHITSSALVSASFVAKANSSTSVKDLPAQGPASKVQSSVEPLATNAVLVVPLEKLPEIAAAISKHVADAPAKKILLTSGAVMQRRVQSLESNGTSSNSTPVPTGSAGGTKTQPEKAVAAKAPVGTKELQTKIVNLSSSAGNSSVSAVKTEGGASQNATVGEARVGKPTLVAQLPGTARNRTVLSLVKASSPVERPGVIPAPPPARVPDLRSKAPAIVQKRAGLVTMSASVRANMTGKAEETQRAAEATQKTKKKESYEGFLSGFVA